MSGDARDDGTGRPASRTGPPRRLLVVGGVAAVLAVLTDNGLRLDLPQPPPPVPTRRPAPDEALLVAVVRDLDALLAAWPRTGRRAATLSRSLLTSQRRVLLGRLTNDGVPTTEVTRPPATTRRLSPTALARRLAKVTAAGWDATASATEATRGLMTAAYATRLSCAGLFGQTIGLGSPSPVRADLAARTAPLVYAFEVVAAQSTGAQRTRALEAHTGLLALDRELGAGTQPGGWSLPRQVTGPKEAGRLGDDVLRTALAATVDALGEAPTAATVEDVARWSARVQLVAVGWGLAPTPFPGTDR